MQRVSDGLLRPLNDVSASEPFSKVKNNSQVSAASQTPLLSTPLAVQMTEITKQHQASPSSSSQPKNDQLGSHVAPSQQ